MRNRDIDTQDREVLELLQDYPMDEASAGFYDRALERATHEGVRRQRNRWIMTGFGSAVAAGLALWLIGGFFLTAPQTTKPAADIPGVVMTLAEPRTVNLEDQSRRRQEPVAARTHCAHACRRRGARTTRTR
jgi:hypothetical protein